MTLASKQEFWTLQTPYRATPLLQNLRLLSWRRLDAYPAQPFTVTPQARHRPLLHHRGQLHRLEWLHPLRLLLWMAPPTRNQANRWA